MLSPQDIAALKQLRTAEDAEFSRRTQGSAALARRAERHMPGGVPMAWMKGIYRTPILYISRGSGAEFFDVDGNAYLDFNLADLAMTMGFGTPALTDAVAEQMEQGAHFLLPTKDAIDVAEALADRTGMPHWQFTLSASGSNTEVIRISRFVTGREKIVLFGGHYHGHIDEMLACEEATGVVPALLGLPRGAVDSTIIVPFNDLDRLEQVLKAEDVALVLTEPALSNCNVLLPQPGFLTGMRDLTRKYGTLLAFDEAHTFQFAYGGLVGAWQLECDFQVLGKGLGTGVSFALYGFSDQIAEVMERHLDRLTGPAGLATGGTTYASALAARTAKAALEQVLTKDNFARIGQLGNRLSDGLNAIFKRHGRPWQSFSIGPRAGYCMTPDLPANYAEAQLSLHDEFVDARRVFMANRGIWDAIATAGPQVSFVHSETDVDRYLTVADTFFNELSALPANKEV